MSLTKLSVVLQSVTATVILLWTCSCVKEGYDFRNGVDGTVDIQGSISLPIGNTELMPIGDFLDLDTESSMLGTDADGNYILSVEGEAANYSVSIPQINITPDDLITDGGFRANIDIASRIEEEYPFLNPSDPVPAAISLDFDMEESTTYITIDETLDQEVTDVVKSISKVTLNAPAELEITLLEGSSPLESGRAVLGGDNGFTIEFPEAITIENISGDFEVVDGHILIFNDTEISAGETSTFRFAISSIDFSKLPDGQGLVNGKISVNQPIVLSSMSVAVVPSEFGSTVGDLPSEIGLDLTLNVNEMSVSSISAVLDPQIDVEDEQFEIGELPDFLSGDNVVLDLYNPVIRFDINAMSQDTPDESFPEFAMHASLDAFKGGSSTMDSPVVIDLSGENLIKKGENHYYISRRGIDLSESEEEPLPYLQYWYNVVVEDLGNLVRIIPDYIQISDIDIYVPHAGNSQDGYQDSDYLDVVFPEDGSDLSYDIDFSYGLEVPLAFGPDLNIGYSTDFNDWNDTFNSESSSSDYTLDFREITIRFDFVNTIPLTLGVTADAIDVDGATMSDISVELSGSIAAGNIGADTSTPLTVRLTASQDALERFDGLRLNISATAAENADLQGITLNKAQGIRLENISASLDGGVQFDPFQKEE